MSQVDTDQCPWCGSPAISTIPDSDDRHHYIFWTCGSSVGINYGDPMQSVDCREMEEEKVLFRYPKDIG